MRRQPQPPPSFYDYHRQRYADRAPIPDAGECLVGVYSGDGTVGPDGEFCVAPIDTTHGRIDLNRGSSASDTVRLVWAYTAGLLETAREAETNHPGLLVMDEPGQHEMEASSLRALFQRLEGARAADQQVVLATSMPFEDIDRLAAEVELTVHRFEDRVLIPQEEA